MKQRPLITVVEELLSRRDELHDEIDEIIDRYIEGVSKRMPGVPAPSLRHMEVDARAGGYSHGAALEQLYKRLLNP